METCLLPLNQHGRRRLLEQLAKHRRQARFQQKAHVARSEAVVQPEASPGDAPAIEAGAVFRVEILHLKAGRLPR